MVLLCNTNVVFFLLPLQFEPQYPNVEDCGRNFNILHVIILVELTYGNTEEEKNHHS